MVINKFIIYTEDIFYGKSSLRNEQSKALEVFKKMCAEIDNRKKMGLNIKYLEDFISIFFNFDEIKFLVYLLNS